MALGDQIGHDTGQITGTRILPGEPGEPKVEVSFEARGHLLNEEVTDMGTYVSRRQPGGSLYGDGQGIIMTASGETALWKGSGVGKLLRNGATSWRGAIYFQTESEKLSRLNGIACVFEYEADESGKVESKTYEWK